DASHTGGLGFAQESLERRTTRRGIGLARGKWLPALLRRRRIAAAFRVPIPSLAWTRGLRGRGIPHPEICDTLARMLARELISLHESPHEVPPFSERYPQLTADAGYRAAQALHEHRVARGWRPVGRKIGFTNRTIWPRYGVYEPIWGTVYDQTMVRATDHRAQ